jgi:hypothetical protein
MGSGIGHVLWVKVILWRLGNISVPRNLFFYIYDELLMTSMQASTYRKGTAQIRRPGVLELLVPSTNLMVLAAATQAAQ